MEDDITLDAVRDLILPRYRLADYDDLGHRTATRTRRILADIRSGRGNVSGFVRIGLFKRLSSSGHSFILSLQRQRARNELFIYAIDNGLDVPLGSFSDHQFMVSDEDLEEDEELLRQPRSRSTVNCSVDFRASTKWLGTKRLQIHAAQGPASGQPDHHRAARHGSATGTRPRTPRSMPWSTCCATSTPVRRCLCSPSTPTRPTYVAQALREAGIANVGLATGRLG